MHLVRCGSYSNSKNNWRPCSALLLGAICPNSGQIDSQSLGEKVMFCPEM